MRAASVTQPWAGLIAAGLKPIENRNRPMIARDDFSKPFALHATREIDESVYDVIYRIAPELDLRCYYSATPPEWMKLSRITSAVIAVATIDRVILATGWDDYAQRYTYDPRELEQLGDGARWLFGRVGYVVRDPIVLPTPVPCRGWQGFWRLDAQTEERVRVQLAEAA